MMGGKLRLLTNASKSRLKTLKSYPEKTTALDRKGSKKMFWYNMCQ